MNPSSPAIDIEGYLFRFEQLPDGNSTWSRKWAILCDFCIYLYNNHGDKECKFAIVLPGARLAVSSISDGDGFQKEAILIEERNGICIELGAENENEFQRWYSHLSAAIKLRKIENSNDPQYPSSHHGSFHRIETFAGQPDSSQFPSYGLSSSNDGQLQSPQYLNEMLVSDQLINSDPAAASDQISNDGPLPYKFSGPIRTSNASSHPSRQGSVNLNGSLRRPRSRLSTDLPDGIAASLGFPNQSRSNQGSQHILINPQDGQGFHGYPDDHQDGQRFLGYPDDHQDGQGFHGYPDDHQDGQRFHGYPDDRQDGQRFHGYPDDRQDGQRFHGYPDDRQDGQGFQQFSSNAREESYRNYHDHIQPEQGVVEEMQLPTLITGVAMEPQMEMNGKYRDSFPSSIENDQRFQSFQELNTMERRRAGLGEFANSGLRNSPQIESQRFQSFPDLAFGDRQQRLQELRRPGEIRGSSLTQLAMETVKEDPGMPETDILATLPLSEIRRRYPVSGLAKRMSIAASDLLGKSHEELVLSLIQLHREKANLETIRDYCRQVLDNINNGVDVVDETQDGVLPENIEERKIRLQEEIDDANQQLEISMPLITFIDNIVKMGSLFAGNDVMFATEYRKHLLSPDQYCPPSSSLSFIRGVQEKNVANTLSRRSQRAVSSDGQESSTYDRLQDGVTGPPESEESRDFIKSRDQLEAELSELENIVVHYHVKKAQITKFMVGQSETKEQPVLGTITEEEGQETPNGTLKRSLRRGQSSSTDEQGDGEKAHLPRRSSSRLLRSDMTMSLRTRHSAKPQYKTLSPNLMARLQRGPPTLSRSRTLPSNFRAYEHKTSMGSQEVYERAESRISSQSAGPNSDPFPRTRYASLPTRYAINEEKLVADLGTHLQLGVARAIPASDSRLDRLTGGQERMSSNSNFDHPLPASTLKAYPENPNLTLQSFNEREHIYQNEPLTNAQSTPSLFRADFVEMKDPNDNNWKTVYSRETSHTPTNAEIAGMYQMDRTPQNDLLFSKPLLTFGSSGQDLSHMKSATSGARDFGSPANMRDGGLDFGRPGDPRDSGLEYGRPRDPRDDGLEYGRPGDPRDSGLEYGRPGDPRDSGLEYGRPGDPRDSGLEYGRPRDPRDDGLEYGRPGDPRDSGLEYGRPGDPRDSGLEYGRPGDPRDSGLEYGRPGDPRDGGLEYGRPGDPRDSGLEYGRPGDPRDSGLEYGRPGDPRDSGLEYGRPGDPRDSGLEYGRPRDPRDDGLEYGRPGDPRDSGLEYGRPGDPRDSGLEYGRPGDPRDGGLEYGRPGDPRDSGLQYGRPGDPRDSGLEYGRPGDPRDSGLEYGRPGDPRDGGLEYGRPGDPRDSGLDFGRSGDPRDDGLEYGRPGDLQDSGIAYGESGDPQITNVRTLDPLSQSSGMVGFQSSIQRNDDFSNQQSRGMITFQPGYRRDERFGGVISNSTHVHHESTVGRNSSSLNSNMPMYYQPPSESGINFLEHEVTTTRQQSSLQWSSSVRVESTITGHSGVAS